jgi:hypothetical protein
MSSLTISLAVLAVTVSNLIRPRGRAKLLKDVRANIEFFSPYNSAATLIGQTIELFFWRLTNIAEISAGLWAVAGNYFYVPETKSITTELGHGVLVTSARRVFLFGIALPLDVFLIRSPCHWSIKWAATFLLAEAASTELSVYHLTVPCAGVVLHRDWPQRPIIARRLFASGPCPGNHVEGPIETAALHEKNENAHEDGQRSENENLCDRVRRIWPPDTRADKDLPLGRHPLEHMPNLAQIGHESGPMLIPWTCGHWRCLMYKLWRVPVQLLLYSMVVVDFAMAGWLLHDNMQAVFIRISHFLLSQRILKDLLTLTFLVAFCIGMSYAIYLVIVLAVPRILRTFGFFRRLIQRFNDMVRDLPSMVKSTGKTGLFWLSTFVSYGPARLLMKRNPFPTDWLLSFIIELLVMPGVLMLIYRRIFTPPKPIEQTEDATQSPPVSSSTSSDSPSTDKINESDYCDKDKIMREAIRKRKIASYIKFRLAVLLPNAAIWIFRLWIVKIFERVL